MTHPDPPPLLHGRFIEQARRTPGQVALMEGDRAMSYAELDYRSSDLAAALHQRGVQPGAVVALHLERSIEWVIGVLGILKAGGTVVPLPPSYPQERLREILEYASFDAVIDDDRWPISRSFDTCILRLADLGRPEDGGFPGTPPSPDQPAFILCSSGSTGRPKMITRSHRSFFHRLEWTWANHPFGEDDIGCHKAPSTTTHGIYELFEPLLAGRPVLVVSEEDSRNLERFWELLCERRVTRLLIVPSALQASLDMPGFVPPPLKVVVLMGEYVPRTLADRAVGRFSAATSLYSIYGSTEASSALVCDLRDPLRPGAELPLGRPIAPGVIAHVLGSDLIPVAPGSTGRLHIGGPLLFSGYFRDPDLTASVLVRLPESGETAYDTHDDVRMAVDGSIEFIGRVDDTVKVRGFRVDLKEVERCLLDHASVRQAAAVADTADPSNPTLWAFVVPTDVDTDSLFAHLRDRLPHYMVPSSITCLESFPLTVRGKLDRRRLLEERNQHHREPTDLDAPNSGLEREVAAIWSGVLGHGHFGRNTSFFEAGGTSLTAFTLVYRLREALGLRRDQLDEQSVYRRPSLADQATLLSELMRGGRPPDQERVPILVTLRGPKHEHLEPFFLVSSAGGTLGAYDKLVNAMQTPREIIGIRDPFLWGERDPDGGFSAWVDLYLEAIRNRQPAGPYFLGAYSSAGAFGYEIAKRLQEAGETVQVLVLIDPLGLDLEDRQRFGWWAMRGTYARPWLRAAIRMVGRARCLLPTRDEPAAQDPGAHKSEAGGSRWHAPASESAGHLAALSALLELNTGLPLTIDARELAALPPEQRLRQFQDRLADHLPEVDGRMMERIVNQYPSQVRAHNAYRIRPYRGRVVLVEPRTPYAGLLRLLLAPYVEAVDSAILGLGEPDARTREITARFGTLASHYRCMRDETFTTELAGKIDRVL